MDKQNISNRNTKGSIGYGLILLTVLLLGCSQEYSSDKQDIANGQATFEKFCSGCHNFVQDGIGPHLGGLTQEVSAEWITKFIKNPRIMMNGSDERANRLLEEYQVFMPPFSQLEEQDFVEILAYINTFDKPPLNEMADAHLVEVTNPVEDTAIMSEVVLNLETVAQVPASAERSPLARINLMVCEPSSKRLFIADLRGKIYQVDGDQIDLFFDISEHVPNFVDAPGLHTGLGSFAFHPGFAENGLMYTTHSEPARSAPADEALPADVPSVIQYVISEWQSEEPAAAQFKGTQRELMRFDLVTGKHGLQEIAFNPWADGPDHPDYGNLYIGIGDGATVEEGYAEFSHHEGRHLWSAIIKIDPLGRNSANGQYGIPSDNPFVDDQNRRDELYAYGFRNPNKFSWDQDGSLYATDIGLRNIEELNKIEAGKFYGWPLREGRHYLNYKGNQGKVYEVPEEDKDRASVYPIIERDHDDLRAIIGGLFYSGDDIPSLSGNYIFGDISSGDLFFADTESLRRGEVTSPKQWRVAIDGEPKSLREITGANRVDLRFGEDCDGNLFIFTKSDGKIRRVVEMSERPS